MSRQVRVDGILYPSIKAASEATGVHRHTIETFMKDGEYAPKQRHIKVEAYNEGANIRFVLPSMKEMAEVLGVSAFTIRKRIDDGNWIFGEYTVKVRRAV